MVSELLRLVARSPRRRFLLFGAAGGISLLGGRTGAATGAARRVIRVDPGNYRAALRGLVAGDTLQLVAGVYEHGLPLHQLLGSREQPIVIEGPHGSTWPPAARFLARPGANTVSILNSAHVVVRNLLLDGPGAAVDAVKAEGHSQWAHGITLENLLIRGHNALQQNVGISTKCPSWNWTVRNCTIEGAGTGMYFGNSDGSAPFFASTIEGNRVIDPIGYALQIKHQRPRPLMAAMPRHRAVTTVTRNVFTKRRGGASGTAARPNMLVGHWPLEGYGAEDAYLIHGNLFFDNPSETLFQGEGNLALYNNLFVNPHGEGVRIQPHNHLPRKVYVFQNTIVAAKVGLSFAGGEDGFDRLFERNLIAAAPPVAGPISGDNRVENYDSAAWIFRGLGEDIGELDLAPAPSVFAARGRLADVLQALPAADVDFLGRRRSRPGYGACLTAGSGARPCR